MSIPILTKRQKQVLGYIARYIKTHDYSPSLQEIRRHLGLSSISAVHEFVEILHSKGYLRKTENQPRSIELNNEKRSETITIPLVGIIAAGEPIEAVEEKEIIELPISQLRGNGEHFALKVRGNSMKDEGIFDGDTVIIKKQSTAENDETVVALINGNEVTLKKIYKEKNGFRLQPANAELQPIFIKELTVQGKVVSVIRSFKAEKPRTTPVKNIKPEKTDFPKNTGLKKHLNNVFFGDVMDLLKQLPNKSVDMVFGDPDYNVGRKYGDKSYTKNFNEYIDWYIELTKESLRVLKDNGNLFMLNYPKQNAHLRVKYLDSLYPFVYEYVWIYNTNVGHTPKRFTTAHRTILHVRKTENNKFYKDNVAVPYQNPTDKRILQNLKNGSRGRMPYSWFYFDLVKNVSKEKTYHACQIPQKLTEMLIRASTMPGDIVLILFGGSGSELGVCQNLKRRYLSAEIDKKYYEMILDRLKNGYIKEKYKPKFGENKGENERLRSLPLSNKEGLFSLPVRK